MIRLIDPSDEKGVMAARKLLEEYTASRKGDPVGPELQADVEDPTMKAKGGVALFLCEEEEQGNPLGLVALRREDRVSDKHTSEMKRLYVSPSSRGKGAGKKLAAAAVAKAREDGFHRIVLDTLPWMQAAQAIYNELGFRDMAEPYKVNPNPGTRYLELILEERFSTMRAPE